MTFEEHVSPGCGGTAPRSVGDSYRGWATPPKASKDTPSHRARIPSWAMPGVQHPCYPPDPGHGLTTLTSSGCQARTGPGTQPRNAAQIGWIRPGETVSMPQVMRQGHFNDWACFSA